jgi:hypothetical protein
MIRPWHVCCNRVQHLREQKSGKKVGYRAYCNEIKRNKSRKRIFRITDFEEKKMIREFW